MLQSNEYFDGKVKSIGFTSSSTGRASVGVMAEGEYTFGTAQPEEMTVVSGALNVLLPGETEWKVYAAGEVFNVPGNSEFHLQVAEPTSYLCRYLYASVTPGACRRVVFSFLPGRKESGA